MQAKVNDLRINYLEFPQELAGDGSVVSQAYVLYTATLSITIQTKHRDDLKEITRLIPGSKVNIERIADA